MWGDNQGLSKRARPIDPPPSIECARSRAQPLLALDHDFEIFAREHQRAVARATWCSWLHGMADHQDDEGHKADQLDAKH